MVDNNDTNPPADSAQPSTDSENLLATDTTATSAPTTTTSTTAATSESPAIDSTLPSIDSSLPPIDSTLPAIDTTLPQMDSTLSSFDTSLPPFDSSVPALPSIDTSMPPLDTNLTATDSHSFFGDTNHGDVHDAQSGLPTSAPGESDNGFPSHTDTFDQSHVNGTYEFSEQPAHEQQQQQQQSHPQPQGQDQQYQQYQQPQQQQYQQPHDMYQNSQAGTPSMNVNASQPMDYNGVQGQQQGHMPQAPIGSPMPSNGPPMHSPGSYMAGYPTQMGMSPNDQMRYQLPGDANKMLSSSRHKKEVKRRTKTGCLTCRKRRIKCDEGHPVCRNCVKSKRDCLGYDPVFRSQASTPSAIQPAPHPAPSLVVTPHEPAPAPQPQTASYPAAPPGYVPAASQPFAPSLPSEFSAPSSTEQSQFNYGAAVDPAVEGNSNSGNMASVQHATNVADGGLQAPANATVKQVQINDLLSLRGVPPPPPHPVTALPPGRLEEIQAVFLATYAPAIDRFFETPWFQEKAMPNVMANAQLMAEYSALIEAFNDRNLEDPNVVARLESFEASVIWSTITLCRHVMNMSNGDHGEDFDLLAASKRLDVIEALLTGDHLESNPLAQMPVREPAADPPALTAQITQRSLDFWSCIGHFLTLHDNEASSAKEIDDTLARCRTLLDTTENRDVIYSVAIARHLGQRWADFPHSLPQPITTNEKDAGAKLYVAQKFLEQQASGSGTTQVSKRVCGMAVRSWFVSRE